MKKIMLLILCLILVFLFTACHNDRDSFNNSSDALLSAPVSDGNQDSASFDENMQSDSQKVYVVKNFIAVEGAVIYDQSYDEYGYPDCCYFHKKCEYCGDVSNNNDSARGNLTTSYYCSNCNTSNHVEIKADSDWIEVNK